MEDSTKYGYNIIIDVDLLNKWVTYIKNHQHIIEKVTRIKSVLPIEEKPTNKLRKQQQYTPS